MAWARTRVPDAVAIRVIATKLRSKLLAQAELRDRVFMRGILRVRRKPVPGLHSIAVIDE